MDLGPFETRSQLSIRRRNQSLPVASLLILLSLPRESQSEIRRGRLRRISKEATGKDWFLRRMLSWLRVSKGPRSIDQSDVFFGLDFMNYYEIGQ